LIEHNDRVTSVFNSAVYEIQSVQFSFNKCKYHSTKGNYDEWRWELDAIWRELSKDAKRLTNGDKNKYQLSIEGLNKVIDLAFKAQNKTLMYRYLEYKEVQLRYLWEDSGKGSKYDEEDDEL